jgi:prepilin-type N-terminal cleavage/methylation domain-containing protein
VKHNGYSFLEVLVAIAVMVIVAGIAVPLAHGSIERSRAAAAARYVAVRLAMARFEAVKRSASVAIRFTEDADGYRFQAYVDGNGNGVLSSDIARDIDRPISSIERLDHHFPGIAFGIAPGVTSLDPGRPLDATDPIQIGPSSLFSFSPDGSSTSGTFFIAGRRASQFAVRVLGATGRGRLFQFDFKDRMWQRR